MTQSWAIRAERPEDAAQVEALDNDGFGPGRFAKTAYRLREGVQPVAALGFVAVEQDALVGSVRFWPIRIGERDSLLLGPLAVRTGERGRGIGIALMQAGIAQARALGHSTILLVGDQVYYARVGFAPLPPGRVRFPGPVDRARILGLSLVPDAVAELAGDVRRARIDTPVCADGAPLG
jgi:predicted N-acetyltransferase YhbS